MLWQEPSEKNPFLILPGLPSGNFIKLDSVRVSDSGLKIGVSSEFIKEWRHGPDRETPAAVGKSLEVIVRGFSELIRFSQGRTKVSTKADPYDFVTEVDGGIEALFKIWLYKHLPHHKVIGEEGVKPSVTEDDYVWVVDPIDGTTNFVEMSPNVAVHLGCIHRDELWFSLVALPFEDLVIYGPNEQGGLSGISLPDSLDEFTKAIGTEYMTSRPIEVSAIDALSKRFEFDMFRIRSIGVNIIAILKAENFVFYKPKAKAWDVVAPLGVLWIGLKGWFDIELYPVDTEMFDSKAVSPISPFCLSQWRHCPLDSEAKNSFRIGFIMVTPKSQPELKQGILETFHSD